MRRIHIAAAAAAVAGASALLGAAPASAANGPTFRDCSLLVAGVDPDFLKLSEVNVGSEGALTVKRGATHVTVEASESSDPKDNEGHVTLTVTVTSPHVATQTVSGAGVGKVVLSAPLRRSHLGGRKYTVEWAATFDNGGHVCPSANTPENTKPNPFIVTVH